jgi:hypothetical protein
LVYWLKVEIIGLVLDAQQQAGAKFILYKIDDGTGCIDVRHWITDDQLPESTVKEGSYARVVGNLKAGKSGSNLEILFYLILIRSRRS